MPLEYLTKAISTHVDAVLNNKSFWGDKEVWEVLPEYVREQYEENRQDLIDSIVVHSDAIIKGVFDDVEKSMDSNDELNTILKEFGYEKLSDITMYAGNTISRGAIRLAAQIFWGSEADMMRAIANKYLSTYFPENLAKLTEVVILILKWILDYRVDDGRTALLLSMGRDTKAAKLEIDEKTKNLIADVPKKQECPELRAQERLIRDIAAKWSGELRTDPASTLLGKRVTVHSQGGCSMPRQDYVDGTPEIDEKSAVTSIEGLVEGTKGVYVVDAAAFPDSVGVNPTATICALAEYKVSRFILGYDKKSHKNTWPKEQGNYVDVHSNPVAKEILDSDAYKEWKANREIQNQLKCLDHLKPCEPLENSVIQVEFNEYLRGYLSQNNLVDKHRNKTEYYQTAKYAGIEDGIKLTINAFCQFEDLEKFLFRQQRYINNINEVEKTTKKDYTSIKTSHLRLRLTGNFFLAKPIEKLNLRVKSETDISYEVDNASVENIELKAGHYNIEEGSYVKFFKKENPTELNGQLNYTMYYRIHFSNEGPNSQKDIEFKKYYLEGTKFLTGVNPNSFMPESTTLHLRLYKQKTKEELKEYNKKQKKDLLRDWLGRRDLYALRYLAKHTIKIEGLNIRDSEEKYLRKKLREAVNGLSNDTLGTILAKDYQFLLAKGTGAIPIDFVFREGLPGIKVRGVKDKSQQSRAFTRFVKFFIERFCRIYGPSVLNDVSFSDTVKRYFDFKQ